MRRSGQIKSRARREWEAQRAARSEREPKPPHRLERTASFTGGTTGAAPKDAPVRHEGYRRLVASLPCVHCFVFGYSQAAHGDQGKGMGIKSDDRTCYPACGPHDGSPGCHWFIGTSGQIPREIRRAMERDYAARTRATIINLGRWPADLPIWDEK
jgi:hypothetical protein